MSLIERAAHLSANYASIKYLQAYWFDARLEDLPKERLDLLDEIDSFTSHLGLNHGQVVALLLNLDPPENCQDFLVFARDHLHQLVEIDKTILQSLSQQFPGSQNLIGQGDLIQVDQNATPPQHEGVGIDYELSLDVKGVHNYPEKFRQQTNRQRFPIDFPPSPSPKRFLYDGSDRQPPADALRKWAEMLPDGIDDRSAKLDSAILATRVELAKVLKPIINERIAAAVREKISYRDKSTLAQTINEQLKLNGMAIRCVIKDPESPDFGKDFPGFIVADTTRNAAGRFRLAYQDSMGKMRHLTLPSLDEGVDLKPLASRLANMHAIEDAKSFVASLSADSPEQNRRS